MSSPSLLTLRSAVSLSCLLFASAALAAPPAMTEVAIDSITSSFHEEEGGSAVRVYHPSGWMQFTGTPSCCGYRPPLKNGWYLLDRTAAQALFDQAARQVALHGPGAPSDDGSGTTVLLTDGRRLQIALAPTVGNGTAPTRTQPPRDWKRRVYVGHHLSSLVALRTLEGSPDEAAKLQPDEAKVVIDALIADPRGGPAMTTRCQRILAHLPEVASDQIAAMLRGPRPVAIGVRDVIEALGLHPLTARAHVAAIAASAQDDGTLAAAAIALAQIGGDEAAGILTTKLVPRLGEAPHEANLQLYYRLAFARALRRIDTPDARAALGKRVFPVVLASLATTDSWSMKYGAEALEIWPTGAEHEALVTAYDALVLRMLHSPKSDDRRSACEKLARLHAGKPPAALRTELERLLTDPDASVRSWVDKALGRSPL